MATAIIVRETVKTEHARGLRPQLTVEKRIILPIDPSLRAVLGTQQPARQGDGIGTLKTMSMSFSRAIACFRNAIPEQVVCFVFTLSLSANAGDDTKLLFISH